MALKRVGTEFQVNQLAARSQTEPDVTALVDGRFLVTYTNFFNDQGTDRDIYGQFVTRAGAPSGSFLQIDHPGGIQWESAVAPRLDGGFTTVWWDLGNT